MSFCLPPKEVDHFKAKLIDGSIDPAKLSQMTSEERHAFLSKITGEANAKGVNALFESKLLLKNQQRGMISWASKVAGLKPEVKRDLISRIERLDHVLDPAEHDAFLKDLAATKLGVDVTQTEASNIAKLSQDIRAAREGNLSTKEQSLKKGWSPNAADLKHGYARYDLQKYVSDLKNQTEGFKAYDLKTAKGVAGAAGHLPRAVADVTKSIGASLDDSFALRQGFKAFFTNNNQWRREFIKSFVNLAKGFKNADAAEREFKAHLMADPHYDQAVKDGLAITKNEDVFPTSAPGKIPIAGRAFNASEVAYSAFAENLRLGIYKQQLKLADKLGGDVPKEFGKNIAKEVNSLTGRGGLGKLEPYSGNLNLAFYSIRFLKSNVDTLLLHPIGVGVGGLGSPAQLKAAKNLVTIIAGTAAILKTAQVLKPGSVSFDPRSADFGKIKVGHTRFDVSGGMGSIIELASRVATQSSKSSTTGQVTKLNQGGPYDTTDIDIIVRFLENKTSPLGRVAVDVGTKKTPQGGKPTVKGEAANLVTPLGVKNFQELKSDPQSANKLAGVLADVFGISANTYGKTTKSWSDKPSTEQQAFRNKVGDAKFKQANQDYNTRLDASMKTILSSPIYKALPADQQKATLTSVKIELQNKVFKENGFKYHKAKNSKSTVQAKKSLLQMVH